MSSIGGNVATNAGGLCCVKYGVTRDYVVGLEVVLASGEVMRTGRRTIKNTVGLDLTGLFVGSEGRLGIITEVTVKLVPQPPAPSTAVAYFDELPPAGVAIAKVFEASHEPSLMEIVDRASLQRGDVRGSRRRSARGRHAHRGATQGVSGIRATRHGATPRRRCSTPTTFT
ncbi:MAG: glycolate oxidase [Candidatus Poriferisodalaceae bacterium]|jgi:glycolate oxidase